VLSVISLLVEEEDDEEDSVWELLRLGEELPSSPLVIGKILSFASLWVNSLGTLAGWIHYKSLEFLLNFSPCCQLLQEKPWQSQSIVARSHQAVVLPRLSSRYNMEKRSEPIAKYHRSH
jgi:hypothetical protein